MFLGMETFNIEHSTPNVQLTEKLPGEIGRAISRAKETGNLKVFTTDGRGWLC